MTLKAFAILAVALVAASCADPGSGANNAGTPASATNAAPDVTLNGTKLDIAGGATTALSACKDNPGPDVEKSVVWQGQGDAPYVAEVILTLLNVNGQQRPELDVRLSNGDHYDSNLKTTHITVDGPSDGTYRFSGTVHKDTQSVSDDYLKTLSVSGGISCSNYGANAGCAYASFADMSTASGLSLNETEDRGLDGCLYSGHGDSGRQYVKVELFPTAGWDEHINRQAAGSHSSMEVVPGIGDDARWVSPVVFVKANSSRSFLVLTAPQSENGEIAVARVLAPRVRAGS